MDLGLGEPTVAMILDDLPGHVLVADHRRIRPPAIDAQCFFAVRRWSPFVWLVMSDSLPRVGARE
jgi:hypothetical protein